MARNAKTTKPATAVLQFEKGAFYEDRKGRIWCCANGRTRKTPDGHEVVDMRATQLGQPVGESGEEYVDTFLRKLTKAELSERVEVERREAEALVEAQGSVTADVVNGPAKTMKTSRSKVAQPKTDTRQKSDGKLSALDAAAKVLAETGEPMTAKAMIDAMSAKGYWTSPGGQTPQATLYAAIIREISKKGIESRFQKVERGQFALGTGTNAPAKTATKATGKKASKQKTDQAEIADGAPGPQAVSELFKI